MTGALILRDLDVRYGERQVIRGLTPPAIRPGELSANRAAHTEPHSGGAA